MSGLLSMKKGLNKIAGLNEQDEVNIRNRQKSLLKIYEDVFKACDKHGLKLFLQGGTLLGKVRHDGFIPWDDDMDLGLSREDYDCLEEVYETELSDLYTLKKPSYKAGTTTRFAQIYRNTDDTSQKIWIDIFPIDYVSDNHFKRIYIGTFSNILMGIAGSIEFINWCDAETRNRLLASAAGKINYYVRGIITFLFGWRDLDKWHSSIEKTVRNSDHGIYCTSSLGRWHYFGEMQKSEVFFPLRPTFFCGIKAWTLNSEKKYLEHNYGTDYMQIPSKEKRERHI